MKTRGNLIVHLNLVVFILLLVSLACSAAVGGEEQPITENDPTSIDQQINEIIADIDPNDPDSFGAPEEIVDMGRPAVPILLNLLDSQELTERYAAIYVLSRLAQSEDIPELRKGLNDPDLSNRATVAATLLWLGDDSGVTVLVEAANSDQVLSFSHPPELLADYAQRVLDGINSQIPAVPEPRMPGIGVRAVPAKLPLRDVKVTLTDCKINIEIKLQFVGDGASEALAELWGKAIKEMWDGRKSSKCCVTSVSVHTKVGGVVDDGYAQVNVKKMPHAGARHTSRMTLTGTVGADGEANNIVGEWDTNDTGAVAAHEVGHALGIDDEYGANGKPTGAAKGEAEGKGAPGIMAQTWSDAEGQTPIPKPRHIDTILKSRGLVCPDKCQAACLATPTPTTSMTPSPTTAPSDTPTLTFTKMPTNTTEPPPTPVPVSGRYDFGFGITQDDGQHGSFIDMPQKQTLWVDFAGDVDISSGLITIGGAAPFVEVSGNLNPNDGTFIATGRGTVAGFPNIAVTFEGLIGDTITGIYGMGVDGGLPGGMAIYYQALGELIISEPTPTTEPASEELQDAAKSFAEGFNQAMVSGDAQFLLDHLHPVVFEKYGPEACAFYLNGVVDPSFQIEILEVRGPGVWFYSRDNFSHPIENTYTTVIDRSYQGQTIMTEMHLTYLDGQVHWFTDCGTPLTTATVFFESPTFCRAGPGLEFEEEWTFAAGTTVPIVGVNDNGWWIVQVDDPNTRTECCWVGAGTPQGDLGAIPLIVQLPPGSSCP